MRISNKVVFVVFGILASVVSAAEVKIEAGGKSQVFQQYWEDYERCKARQEFTPERGEYETQEEYRRRVEKLRVGCDTYRRVEQARIEVPVILNYDADKQRFLFELPTTRGLRLQYDGLVRDDFPKSLNKLPRDRWHIDDPTPKASAYKECTLRSISADEKLISKIEPCRINSWRGCMTYYRQGEEGHWQRDQETFSISDVTFYAYADIASARRIKNMEADLIYRVEGALLVPEQGFDATSVEILNRKTGERLVIVKP